MRRYDTATKLAEFVERHEQLALLFSGGKDSIACLELLRPAIDKVTVLWSNPGDPYPETLALIESVRNSVPRFVEIRSDVLQWHQDFGRPVDMLPFENSPVGRLVAGDKPAPKMVLLDQCCNANMWRPLFTALHESKATGCVRGDKRSDPWRPRFESNTTIDGVEYHLPLLEWSDEEVFGFVGDAKPASYARGHKASFDCMTCTAYLQHNPGRLRELAELDPMKYHTVMPVLWLQRDAALGYAAHLEDEL
jgi:3'-phosphoadenosine 5'-phosphosulfate sulfotransferase (PAPS reductase)/FAD synthetase